MLTSTPSPSRQRLNLGAVLLLLLAPAPAALGQLVLQVDRTDDLGFIAACDSMVANDCTLRGAINLANAQLPATDVVIELEAETYVLTTNGAGDNVNATGDLDITRDMTIRGQGAELTTISGGGVGGLDDRLVDVINGFGAGVIFEDLGFVDSKPPGGEYAVFVREHGAVTLRDCRFHNNGSAVTGGGGLRLESFAFSGLVENCTFTLNRTNASGAAVETGAESLVIQDSFFSQNVADGNGGAVQAISGPVAGTFNTQIMTSTFSRNQAAYGGAVMLESLSNLTVQQTSFDNNIATIAGVGTGLGGAIYTSSDTTVNHSTFSANQAEDVGAAIFASGVAATLDVFNSTISGHATAAIAIGGSSAELLHATLANNAVDVATELADIVLTNSILTAGCDLFLGTFQTKGGNLVVDNSCWGGAPAMSDQVVLDFGLNKLGSYDGPTKTHLPKESSVAVGAAPTCPPNDQRLLGRPGVNCTSGAVERQAVESFIFGDCFESGDTSAWSLVVP